MHLRSIPKRVGYVQPSLYIPKNQQMNLNPYHKVNSRKADAVSSPRISPKRSLEAEND